jgi:choline kinase
MKGLILAAGVGSRLKTLTQNSNKCAINISGIPIIKRIVDTFETNNIQDINIITGHAEKSIMSCFDQEINYIYNPIYHAAGILVSIWLSRDNLSNEPFILSTGDNVFDPKIFPKFLETKGDIVVVVRKKQCTIKDVKVMLNSEKIIKFEEDMPLDQAAGEFGMLIKFSNTEVSNAFFNKIKTYLNSKRINARLIDVLNSLIEDGYNLSPCFIETNQGIEVDTFEDLEKAEELMKQMENNNYKPTLTQIEKDTNLKGVILAAGRGRKLKEITRYRNKSAIKIGGKSIIKRTVDLYKNNNINEIHIVTGYLNQHIEEEIGNLAIYSHNPMFDSAGILLSTWLLKEKIEGERFILSTGDYISDPEIFPNFLAKEGDVVVAVRKKLCKDNDIKVKVDKNKIIELDEDILIKDAIGEFAMMIKFNNNSSTRFFQIVKDFLTQQKTDARIVDILNTMIIEGYNVVPHFIESHQGIEINYFEDIEEAEKRVINYDNPII